MLLDDEQAFGEQVRRRKRLTCWLAASIGAAVLLLAIAASATTRVSVGLTSLGFFACAFSLFRLQGDGFIAPSAKAHLFGQEAAGARQAGVPFVLVLWGMLAIVVAFAVK